jgi:hypothetical protein
VVFFHTYCTQPRTQFYDNAAIALISHQKIAAVSQNKIILLDPPKIRDKLRQFLLRLHNSHALRLAAYPKGSMPAHGFMK